MIRRITWLGAIFGVLIVLSLFLPPFAQQWRIAASTVEEKPPTSCTSATYVDCANAYTDDLSYAERPAQAEVGDNVEYSNYGFNLGGGDSINSVKIRTKHCVGVKQVKIGVQVYDGSSWSSDYTFPSEPTTCPTTEDDYDVTSFINTPAKLNAIQVRYKITVVGGAPSSHWHQIYYTAVIADYTPNAPPSVTSVTLTDTSMTPQTEYSVTVAVSDADNLSDLTTVVLKVYYDTDTTTNETEYDGKTADTQNCAVITYDEDTDNFSIQPAADTTWSLGACEAFTSEEKAGTTGDCIFVFKPGKVATETTGSAIWQVAAKATDSASQTGWNYDDTPGATMAWYGEIDVPDATTVDWGFVAPGLDFGEDTASEEAVGVTITYISNGAYDKKVKTTSPWSGSSYTATLDSTGACSSANEFALKADDTGTLSSAVLVDTSGVIIDDSGGITSEAGDEVTTHTLWLKLASSFNADTYSGTVTYIIAEHV